MDGVLADWLGKFKQLSNNINPEDYKQRFGQKAYYDLIDSDQEKYYSELNWLPDGKILVDYLQDYPVEILSSGPTEYSQVGKDRKSTRLNSSHVSESRMPSSA